jgi:hypothetical protein
MVSLSLWRRKWETYNLSHTYSPCQSLLMCQHPALQTHWQGHNFCQHQYLHPVTEPGCVLHAVSGRAIAQAVSRRLPTAAARVQTRVWACGILWWTKVALEQVFSENFGLPCYNLHSICFSIIIFIITRGCHNRPGVAAVPITSQTK